MAREIKLISSMAAKDFLLDIAKQYQVDTGDVISVTTVGGVEVMRRVKAGEALDVVVLSAEQIDQLIADGAVLKGSRVDLVKSGVAVAVRRGAERRDISSEAAVKKAVLGSKSIGYSTGPSGVYLERLLASWDPDKRVKRVQAVPGTPVGSLVAKGEVELGFQQLSELIHLQGIEVLGPLPPAIQLMTTFSAGVSVKSSQAEAVRAALAYMASPEALEAKRRNGLSAA
ncbi:MAG TPA: substrate-binding domain-containing protein [Burkholderiales bacterium]|jgi:molybdate transport system substrate-binding protein|nr:substrate-binding domain-containing protein [Burkholderiales bacterium]